MITATISGAQLDTIDPAELAQLAEAARVVDRLDAFGRRFYGVGFIGTSGLALRAALFAATLIDCNAPAGDPRKLADHVLTMPQFEEIPRFNFARNLPANPRAPIPDRIRRRMDRGRDRR